MRRVYYAMFRLSDGAPGMQVATYDVEPGPVPEAGQGVIEVPGFPVDLAAVKALHSGREGVDEAALAAATDLAAIAAAIGG